MAISQKTYEYTILFLLFMIVINCIIMLTGIGKEYPILDIAYLNYMTIFIVFVIFYMYVRQIIVIRTAKFLPAVPDFH